MNKPAIPAHFRVADNFMGLYCLLHGGVIWLGSSQLALWLFQFDSLPSVLRIVLCGGLAVVAGMGMFMLGSLGHEGFHGNLNRNRYVSMLLGILASTAVPTFCSVGLNVYHWRHHARTNTEHDPDFKLYAGRRTFLGKSAGPLRTSAHCLSNTVKLLRRGEKIDRGFPFGASTMQCFAWFNVGVVLLVTAAWTYLLICQPLAFMFFLALPALVGQVYWTLHPYIEHADTGTTHHDNARDCTSPALGFLLLGYTYHHCHHLYPNVPAYRLPALRRHLERTGYLDGAPVQRTLFGALWIGMTGVLRT